MTSDMQIDLGFNLFDFRVILRTPTTNLSTETKERNGKKGDFSSGDGRRLRVYVDGI